MNCILIVGASSDFGIELINNIKSEYDIIYAHFAHDDSKLLKIKEELGDKIILIKDDLLSEYGGRNIIETINNTTILPNKIVYFPSYNICNTKFTKIKIEDFDNHYKLSVKSCVGILQPLIDKILKQKLQCQIVVMLSSYTRNSPPKYLAPYVSSKYALLGLVKSLAVEYADKNITINGVSPDMTNTKFLNTIPSLMVEQYATNTPSGKILSVKDTIPTIRFLLSDDAKHITGQNIIIC